MDDCIDCTSSVPKNCNGCKFKQMVSKHWELEDYCILNNKSISRMNMQEDCSLVVQQQSLQISPSWTNRQIVVETFIFLLFLTSWGKSVFPILETSNYEIHSNKSRCPYIGHLKKQGTVTILSLLLCKNYIGTFFLKFHFSVPIFGVAVYYYLLKGSIKGKVSYKKKAEVRKEFKE